MWVLGEGLPTEGLSPHSTSDLCSFLNCRPGAIGPCSATRDKFCYCRKPSGSRVLSCHSQEVWGELLEAPLLPFLPLKSHCLQWRLKTVALLPSAWFLWHLKVVTSILKLPHSDPALPSPGSTQHPMSAHSGDATSEVIQCN